MRTPDGTTTEGQKPSVRTGTRGRVVAPGGPRHRPSSVRLAAVGAVWVLVVIGLVALPLAIGVLAWRGRAPREVVVPDVVGRSVDEARKTLRARRLPLAVVDEAYDPEIPAGVILWMNPPAGRVVREEREIAVRVSKGARSVETPDVTHLPLTEAGKRIETAGLTLGECAKGDSENLPEGTVMSQAPQPGRRVVEGTAVELLVSTGRAPKPAPSPNYQREMARVAEVSVLVPQGDVAQRVQIRVKDMAGEWTAYDALHEPGDTVSQRVVAHGPGRVIVSVDGKVIQQKDL